MTAKVFCLDAQLGNDTRSVGALPLSELLLMNDNRWPWFILVPRIVGAEELHHISMSDQLLLTQEINQVAHALETIVACDKMNIASLGNRVRQLHVHIVARQQGDANWPNTVWGFGQKQAYNSAAAEQLIKAMRTQLA